MYHCFNRHLTFLTSDDTENVFHFIMLQHSVFSIPFKLQNICRNLANLGCGIEIDHAFFKLIFPHSDKFLFFLNIGSVVVFCPLCYIKDCQLTNKQYWSTDHIPPVCVCLCLCLCTHNVMVYIESEDKFCIDPWSLCST